MDILAPIIPKVAQITDSCHSSIDILCLLVPAQLIHKRLICLKDLLNPQKHLLNVSYGAAYLLHIELGRMGHSIAMVFENDGHCSGVLQAYIKKYPLRHDKVNDVREFIRRLIRLEFSITDEEEIRKISREMFYVDAGCIHDLSAAAIYIRLYKLDQ
jgi:hypothetical protein